MRYPKLLLDCKLRPQVLSLDIVEEFTLLEPFGTGNPAPLFGLYSMTLTGITPCGKSEAFEIGLPAGKGQNYRHTFFRNAGGISLPARGYFRFGGNFRTE